MIHTYSLIHDDLPALDNDDLRRGVPTCHVVFGEAIAILAGDALLTHGLGLLARYPREEVYAAAKLKALDTVVDAIGTTGMIGGQVADLEAPEAPRRRRRSSSPPSTRARPAASSALRSRSAGSSRSPGTRTSSGWTGTGARSGSRSRSRTICSTSNPTPRRSERRPARMPPRARRRFRACGASSARARCWPRRSRRRSAAARALPGGGGRLPDLARFVGERKS